ncbi:glucan endo-1,3-beta-glucosidase-like [Cicer arietinum]|uniref:glucan endo-1,3-beta-D-glucosidase n=1 Tax=Cicer arietinum TaxID=3827 RepID=A0A3Q7XT29_CICAR|nr:glucan endo-1,3-beta-glucosidase-like [Cicer arietinum]
MKFAAEFAAEVAANRKSSRITGGYNSAGESAAAQSLGVCYGIVANNLPPVVEVIDLFKTNGIARMRIYNPNQATLEALRGSNIELAIGVSNEDIQSIANDISSATSWVQINIINYANDVIFRYIIVGNEISHNDPTSQFVLRAMQNIYGALGNLQNQIKISTTIQLSLLGSSYPPSQGEFSPDAIPYITPIVNFLASNGAPLLANVYPYFAYISDQKDISLEYATFTQQGYTDIGYQNLFDAMLDALYAAILKTGASDLQIVVSESGWPSAGGEGATTENAAAYYTNLINHVNSGNGTPMRPGQPIETYLFAMFDENLKPGAASEQYFGLFTPDKSQKYNIASIN